MYIYEYIYDVYMHIYEYIYDVYIISTYMDCPKIETFSIQIISNICNRPTPGKITSAVRDTSVSRHNGGLFKSFP